MTREHEKQVSKARREQRTDKQFQTTYSEQAVREQSRIAANESNRAYGFNLRFEGGR